MKLADLQVFGFKCQNLPLILNPIALRKTKVVYNFGVSECNSVKQSNKQKKKNVQNRQPAKIK